MNTIKTDSVSLTATQKAALLHFAGVQPRTVQSNHQINGERACERKGLIRVVYSGRRVESSLTQAGAALVASLTAGA
jgi:hypothetical protein